ncbi:uncharacterized protein [Panulirus ornatus]|uniref:uncharacterized protein n=1 Tax=Panulirus ornatus TaxID=150431 RepID=UPI003A8A434F
MESKSGNMLEECISKLCKEAQKVDKELAVVEAIAVQQAKVLQKAREQRDHLLEELNSLESRKHSVRHQLKKCEEQRMVSQCRIKEACKRVKELGYEEDLVKEDTARIEAVAKVALQRIKSWELIQQQQQGTAPEEVSLMHSRQVVGSLRDSCISLSHVPSTLHGLRSQVSTLRQQCVELEQQMTDKNKMLRSLEEEVNRAHQDVRVYKRRKEDHEARLKIDIEQVSGRNACLAMELSQLESGVTKLRDMLEAYSKPH